MERQLLIEPFPIFFGCTKGKFPSAPLIVDNRQRATFDSDRLDSIILQLLLPDDPELILAGSPPYTTRYATY